MDYRQLLVLLLLLVGKGLAKCKNQQQQQREQHQQWQLHSQLPEGACSGIRQLEVATRQAGNEAATKRFSNLPNGNHFLIIVAASCNIIIIAIKPHFSSHALPPLLPPYRHAHASVAAVLISCLAAASLCHISNTFTVNSKGIMRLLSFLFLLQLFLLLPLPLLHRKPSVCFAAAEIAAVSDSQQITGSAREHECDYEYECECGCEQKYL